MHVTDQNSNLDGRTAVVTGGASGIGEAIALRFLCDGATVLVADRCLPDYTHRSLKAQRVDVGRAEDVQNLYLSAKEYLGIPDLLVAAAGVGVHERLDVGDPEKWAELIQTNLIGVLRLVRAFLPEMVERGSGDIVVVSSVAAERPYEYGGPYAASKAAVAMAAETLRLEVCGKVRTTVVSPGMVKTGFFANHLGGARAVGEGIEGALQPEEVADAIAYAVTRPPHLVINELVIRPVGQLF